MPDTLMLRSLFADGFDEVFPIEKLHSFSPSELQTMMCGDQAPMWTRDDVLNYTDPKLGYTRERWVVRLDSFTTGPAGPCDPTHSS